MNIKMPTFYLFPSLCKLLFTVVQLKPLRHMYAIIFPKRFYLQNFTAFYSYGVIGANLGNCDFKKSLTGTYDSIISGYCELSIQPIKVWLAHLFEVVMGALTANILTSHQWYNLHSVISLKIHFYKPVYHSKPNLKRWGNGRNSTLILSFDQTSRSTFFKFH